MEQKHGEGFEWHPARVNLLLALKAKGYSAAQIAKQIGCGLTRSAVIGKLDRMHQAGTYAGRRQKRKPADDHAQATDPGNKGKAKMTDISPAEFLDLRRFSWEKTNANP